MIGNTIRSLHVCLTGIFHSIVCSGQRDTFYVGLLTVTMKESEGTVIVFVRALLANSGPFNTHSNLLDVGLLHWVL